MDRKSFYRVGFISALGFGIGGLIVACLTLLLEIPFLFGIQGLIGGLILGASLKDKKKKKAFILYGLIGFTLSFMIGTVAGFIFGGRIMAFTIGGALGGLSLGIAYKNRKAIGLMTLYSAVGFSVSSGVVDLISNLNNPLYNALIRYTGQLGVSAIGGLFIGLIGGFTIGLTAYYLNTQTNNVMQNTRPRSK